MIRRLGLVVMVLVVGVSACASGSTNSTDSSSAVDSASASDDAAATNAAGPGTNDDVADETATTQTAGQGGTSMAASSPIGAFFDGGFNEALAEYTVRVEESVLVCMAAQGFEFAVSENGRVNEIEQRQNDLTVREWTSEYGFGISTSFESVARTQSSDPNVAIFLTMSESERELWAQTLSGGPIEALDGDFTGRPLEDQGCIGQALIETGGQVALEGLSEFGDIYQEGEAALLDRREMVAAVDAWGRCMGEAGFPNYADLDAPEDAINDRFDEVIAPLEAALDELSDEEGQALISGESFDIANLPDLDVASLRELQADEVTVALADLDCYVAEVQAIYEPLRDEFERGLLDEYATEFDALKNIGS